MQTSKMVLKHLYFPKHTFFFLLLILGWNIWKLLWSASTHKFSPNVSIIAQAHREACNSPPHERVDVFFHHAVKRQPDPIPPSVEHVMTSSHHPTAERTTLTHTSTDRECVSQIILLKGIIHPKIYHLLEPIFLKG